VLSDNVELKPRSPKEDVMKLILEDIEQAVLLFPEDGYINKNLASKPAAYALKADVLKWKAKVLNGGNADRGRSCGYGVSFVAGMECL